MVIPLQWICCQMGAREHYAIPRSLAADGSLRALITDTWMRRGRRSLAQFGVVGKQLATRWHSDLETSDVRCFNLGSLARRRPRRSASDRYWDLTVQRNRWFSSRCASEVDSILRASDSPHRHVVFAYSYAAIDTLRVAKAHGAYALLGQIDPGPAESELVSDLELAHGLSGSAAPPTGYWDSWREECALADKMVVNSEWSKYLLEQAGADVRKIAVIPLVIDEKRSPHLLGRQAATSVTPDELRLLYLGRISARKGLLELADAAGQLKGERVRIQVAGDGHREIRERLEEHPNIELVGQLPRSAVIKTMAKADALVLPTHSDGFALVQLEAVAAGLPLLATRHCGEVVSHEQNGLLLPSASAESIVQAVRRLLHEPGLLNRLKSGQAATANRGLSDLANDLKEIVP